MIIYTSPMTHPSISPFSIGLCSLILSAQSFELRSCWSSSSYAYISYGIALFHHPHPHQHRRWILETTHLQTPHQPEFPVPTANWGSYEWCVCVYVWESECVWESEWVSVCMCVINDQSPTRLFFGGWGCLCMWCCRCQHRHLFPQSMNIGCYWVQLCNFSLHTRMYVCNWTCVDGCVRGAVGVWCHQSLSVVSRTLPRRLLSITHTHSQSILWFQKWEISMDSLNEIRTERK